MWGKRFSATYGESALTKSAFVEGLVLTEVAKTWAAGLSGFTPEHIGNGLRQCINRGYSWPPTLPEFVKMCKVKPPPKCYVPAIESDELKERRKEQYKTGITEVKKILNQGE